MHSIASKPGSNSNLKIWLVSLLAALGVALGLAPTAPPALAQGFVCDSADAG